MKRRKLPDLAIRITEEVEKHGGCSKVSMELRVAYHTLGRWMDGSREPSPWWICVLAAYFEITPTSLLGVRMGKMDERHRLGVDQLFHEIRRARDVAVGDPLEKVYQGRLKRAKAQGVQIEGLELKEDAPVKEIRKEPEEGVLKDERQ